MEEFLIEARKLAYDEVEKTGMPVKLHVDLATEVGKKLAKELGANVDIVEAGTLLMDCLIGQALKENRQNEHVQISLEKANELLMSSFLSEDEKENIRHCVLEHHGTEKFYSLESEIVCNADCYRFTSIKGFSFALRYLRDMPFNDLIKLLNDKLNEKWSALSLDICKKELESQHKTILEILKGLK
jgi:hypothetical protein